LAYEHKEGEDLKAALVERIGKFREVMTTRRNIPLARQLLRNLLAEPIRCIPIMQDGRKDYALRGKTRLGGRLSSAGVNVGVPTGNPISGVASAVQSRPHASRDP
jgi:hypothetical protein